MAKSNIVEKHNLTLTGVLDLSSFTMEFEEIGTKGLTDLLEKFDGENVTISISLKTDLG